MFIALPDEVLAKFDAIKLSEMDEIAFMNRTDTKFLLHSALLPQLLLQASKHYKILEINKHRIFNYQTTYLDTPELILLKEHLRGRSNRIKIRFRTYCETNVRYLEVKRKNNRGYTQKWRTKIPDNLQISDEMFSKALKPRIHCEPQILQEVITNHFSRITLAGSNPPERITIDTGLSFNAHGTSTALNHICIVELKKNGFSVNTPFYTLLHKIGATQTGFSKYAMGMLLTMQYTANHVLKPKTLLFDKLNKKFHPLQNE